MKSAREDGSNCIDNLHDFLLPYLPALDTVAGGESVDLPADAVVETRSREAHTCNSGVNIYMTKNLNNGEF